MRVVFWGLTSACVALLATCGNGCGRKASPVAVVSPPKSEARQPVFPTAAVNNTDRQPEESEERKVADFGDQPPVEVPPPIVVPPSAPAPTKWVGQEEVKPVPPIKPVRREDPLPKRIIEQDFVPVAPPKPVLRRPVTKSDMTDIHLFIDTATLASGRMPDPVTVQAALGAAGSPAAKLVASQDVILTGSRHRESCWAYQKGATTDGGWIVTNNGAEQVDAVTAKRWLGTR